ncbi:hypothetical protein E2C01_014649 [Portunus trituberculatus]|uniref:Uncharacterized protein n=1 Tax=Portunus trituberculatus TaxID=210409 RepID=A0A5B7DKN1_PORTR|nr:hypothetical protein [Portunus trituberculatus]
MANPNPASESLSGGGGGGGPEMSPGQTPLLITTPKCHDTSLNFFYINFCNISGLRSNFNLWNTTSLINFIFFSTPKHNCLRQLTVAPALFPPTFSILIFVPKLDVASM